MALPFKADYRPIHGISSPDLRHISISNAISRAAIVVHLSGMTCSVMTGAVFSFRMPSGRGGISIGISNFNIFGQGVFLGVFLWVGVFG